MRSQYPKIFIPTAPVSLAAPANFQHLAELTLGQILIDNLQQWMITVAMGHRQLGVVFLAGGNK